MSVAQGMTVAPALLDCLADRLCDVEMAIQGISQALKAEIHPNALPFVTDALLMALSERVTRCFEALDETVSSSSKRQSKGVAHAPRA